MPSDEAQLRECEDPIAIEGGLEREIEAGERFDGCQPTHLQRRLYTAVLPWGQLFGKENVDRFECRQPAMLQAADNMVEGTVALTRCEA